MKIEYLRIQNFLCVGSEPVEIDFTKFGRISVVKGRNLDLQDDYDDETDYKNIEDKFHSNAAGKSTISEALSYGLFGETIRKKLNHNTVINRVNKSKLEVEVIFSIEGKRYRVLRKRKPDSVQLWHSGPPWIDQPSPNHNEMTAVGQPTTQKEIQKIIKMSHKAFVNVICFGQHNEYNFLECTSLEQREIAESLLSLDVYKTYSKTAKDELKDLKDRLKEQVLCYEKTKESESMCRARISQIERQQIEWQSNCFNTIKTLKDRIALINREMANTDIGTALIAYDKAQDSITVLNIEVSNNEQKCKQLDSAVEQTKDKLDDIRQKLHEFLLSKKSLEQDLSGHQKVIAKCNEEIKSLKDLKDGAKCSHCFGIIDKQHYKHVVVLNENKIESSQVKIQSLQAQITAADAEIAVQNQTANKIKELQQIAIQKRTLLSQTTADTKLKLKQLVSIPRPELGSKELVLSEKISQIESMILDKSKEVELGGPYLEILATVQSDLNKAVENKEIQKKDIAETEGLIPYYEYWVKGFGDDGIRAFIIEGIIPALNSRIAYWLHYLINNKLTVSFNKHLDVVIDSNPPRGEFVFYACCGSEKKRINLAISQAFAHVMMLSSGTWPSLVFLDEVSDSIDQKSIVDVYKMTCELSNEKQVFVITHNNHLREMLDGADTITMVKKDGITKRLL